MEEHEAAIPQAEQQENQQETQQVQHTGGVSYISEGEGVPVVFLHGVGGAARQFAGAVTAFGRRYRTIAWDMPGYGHSEPLPLVTMAALAAALGNFIAVLGLQRPVLVGHSLGGMIVQRLLAEAPHVARAIVLAQTSAVFGGRDPAWGDEFIRERLGPLDEGRSMAELAPAMVAAMAGPGADPAGLALARDCVAHTPDSTYRDTVLAMRGFDERAALSRIVVPTLVLAGGVDPNAPPSGMRRMADQIPGARYVELEGVGHLAHLEAPARFEAALGDFLASSLAEVTGA